MTNHHPAIRHRRRFRSGRPEARRATDGRGIDHPRAHRSPTADHRLQWARLTPPPLGVAARAAAFTLACGLAVAAAHGKTVPPDQAPAVDSEANLIRNGGFDAPAEDAAHPAHWQSVDNLVWRWIDAPDEEDRGKVIKIDTDVKQKQAYRWWIQRFVHGQGLAAAPEKAKTTPPKYDTIAGLDGGFYWSHWIPVKQGGAYRVYVDAKGPASLVFMRGYEEKPELFFADEHPSVQEVFRKARGESEVDERGRPKVYRLRYIYTTKFRVGGSKRWKTYTHEMPRHPNSRQITEGVRWVRIMLYPHWPPGVYWYDNVRVVEVAPDAQQADPDAEEADYEEGKVVR